MTMQNDQNRLPGFLQSATGQNGRACGDCSLCCKVLLGQTHR